MTTIDTLESSRDVVRERAAERLRVAQEVHDILGHGLVAIKMQADIAIRQMPQQPEQAQAALETISRTSSEAMGELRAALLWLRDGGHHPPRQLGLPQLDDLCQRMTEAGLTIHVSVTGQPRGLTAAADLAAYRVLQEALTNVLRHSPARQVRLDITWSTDALALSITSPGTSAQPTPGLGISGMRARVEALGGSFTADANTCDEFIVTAQLPARRMMPASSSSS